MVRLLVEHLPLSLAIGLGGWWFSANPWCVLSALVAGWMIDADHLFDFGYYLVRQGRIADPTLVRTGGYFKINNKVFVPLHAWEITFVLVIVAIISPDARPILLSSALAHGIHLIYDQKSYGVRRFGYLILSRAMRSFEHQGFCQGQT